MKHNTLENLNNIHKYYRVSKVIPGIRDLTRIQREIRETFWPGEAGKFGYGYGTGKENDIRDIVERSTGMRGSESLFPDPNTRHILKEGQHSYLSCLQWSSHTPA